MLPYEINADAETDEDDEHKLHDNGTDDKNFDNINEWQRGKWCKWWTTMQMLTMKNDNDGNNEILVNENNDDNDKNDKNESYEHDMNDAINYMIMMNLKIRRKWWK